MHNGVGAGDGWLNRCGVLGYCVMLLGRRVVNQVVSLMGSCVVGMLVCWRGGP